MQKLMGALIGVLGSSVFIVAGSPTTAFAAGAGDTCSVSGSTGSGNASFVVSITVPTSAGQQYGFAFGLPGTSVMNAIVSGTQGTLSTQSLPTNTTGAWITTAPLTAGTLTADIQSNNAPATSGMLTVVPASGPLPNPTYLAPFTCALNSSSTGTTSTTGSTTQISNDFTVAHAATYDSASRVWHLTIKIPGAGVVSALEPEPTVGTTKSKSSSAPTLVHVKHHGLKSAGSITLTLRPTTIGDAYLRAHGHLTVKLDVSFAPKGGKVATRLIKLTLNR